MDFLDFHHHNINKAGIYNIDYQEEIPFRKFSVGLHPKDITENWRSDFEKIKEMSLSENCVALGECGLDGLIDVDENLQMEVFIEHISWAEKIHKPVIIHCVRRFSEMLKFKNTQTPLIIHGFNKKKTIADEMLNAGFFLSFGKGVLENLSLQKTTEDFPINKMFLESDDSDFDILQLYRKIADIKAIPLEELKKQMWKNLENILNHG